MHIGKSSDELHHDSPVTHGIFKPKQIIPPGTPSQDGYRTPTLEDYERRAAHSARDMLGQACKLPSNSHNPSPGSPSGIFGKHHNLSSLSVSHRIVEKLQWRERIRHFTWTFFTITMATGGVANVIYTGKPPGLVLAGWLVAKACGSPLSFQRSRSHRQHLLSLQYILIYPRYLFDISALLYIPGNLQSLLYAS